MSTTKPRRGERPAGTAKSGDTAARSSVGPQPAPKILKKALGEVDSRFGLAGYLKRSMNKVFPDHWSFMLGEIALYSFIVLLLSGTFLTFFFRPGTNTVVYPTTGNYVPLRGLPMTEAFESTLRISFDVRGGLLIRQIHHWAALLFMAAIVAHCCRIFFTGAFRKPREANWLIGVALVTLGLLEGFAGYSLPDDLLSGTGLRIAYGIIESIPIVGTYLGSFVFGGQFPGPDFIPRLFTIHILLVPGILLALITVHLLLMWYQKHTQWPAEHRTNDNVVGAPFYPAFMAKTGGFFFAVFAVTAGLSALVQINPVWLYGPYNPAQVGAGSQPDFYIGWLEGTLRMMPDLETHIDGHTISWNVLIPAVVIPGSCSPQWPSTPSSKRGSPATTRFTTSATDHATGLAALRSVSQCSLNSGCACWRAATTFLQRSTTSACTQRHGRSGDVLHPAAARVHGNSSHLPRLAVSRRTQRTTRV